jgi:flagellar assembly factor FliW
MTLLNTRFGPIDYEDQDVICFEEGLIGFPQCKSFLILTHKPESPFRWLQSVDEPALSFLVAEPLHFFPDYSPLMPEEDVTQLSLKEQTPRLVLTTASIPHGAPEEMTLNLAGPIVINATTRRGKQIVLEDEAYTMKHRVFEAATPAGENVAA